jgi:hypothetical protein
MRGLAEQPGRQADLGMGIIVLADKVALQVGDDGESA